VEILIDGDWWEAAPEKEQLAVLDHEFTHIAVSSDDDDLGRPKIELRYHDYEFGWFRSVAERHGKASQECQQMAAIVEESGQFLLPFQAGTTYDPTKSRIESLEVMK